MLLKNHRLFVAAALFATSLVALFGGCGLSTHGTATNTEARCTAASQCNDNEACTTDECTADGVCTHTALADGDGPASTQMPGSCQKTVCKSGVLVVVNDDQNVSDDGEFCTDDECKDGKPTHPKKAESTECKVGKATGHCAAGKCAVECGVGLPACDDKNACTDDTCDVANGKCVFAPLDGIKIPGVVDKPGDCKTPRCVGGTAVETAVDDTDLPTATSDCVTPTCTGGVPSQPALPVGQGCATSNGTVCDGDGACVACNVEGDCTNLPASNECQTRTCKAHKCGTDFQPDNTALVSQQPGDCQILVCDGKGNKVSRNDDADKPVDGNDCRSHLCVNGVPQTPPLVANTKCGANQAFVCDGAGSCVGCNAPTDCSGVDDDCQTRTCDNKTCGFKYQPDGTPLPVPKQKSGDCQQLQCNGAGLVKSFEFDTDLPIDGNDCTADVCQVGVPSNPAMQTDSLCSKGYCDGKSACVQCTKPTQCPNPPICVTATCNSNVCGTSNVALGTQAPAGQQTPADCKDAVCDGNGGTTTQPNVGDLPNDNNQCTSDTCTAQGVPSFAPKASHTSCSQNNGKVCDGSGTCIGCVDNVDCTAPSTCGGGNPGTANVCGCTKKTCAQQNATCGTVADGCGASGTIACNDSLKDGSETDVDCGGNGSTCGVKCGQGKACGANSDCSSGFCADGVCCNAACTGAACKACSKALNGVADGQCLDATIGAADPRSLCAAGDVCAANAKCRCADGAKDGAETDVDCGGGVCGKCGAGGKGCSVNTDCTSGFCADSFCCDKACSGACVACSKLLNAGANGTCGNIANGGAVDPTHGSCTQANDLCGLNGACRCGDGTKNGAETDIDCGGGTCAKCAQGKTCSLNGDCAGGACVDGFCCDKACSGVCEACSNAKTGLTNGTCGGLAAGSAPKAACPNAADVCGAGGKCRCGDGAKDGSETDVDCGGAVCGKCAQGKACTAPADCSNANCVDKFCCDKDAATCSGCQACAAALTAGANGTCSAVTVGSDPHSFCAHNAGAEVCAANGLCSCADGVKSLGETDVDCGGATCDKCADGKVCSGGGDCTSGLCANGKCAPSTCSNSVKDVANGETDVDCGGLICQKCADGKTCLIASDCNSNTCIGGKCYPATCTNGAKDGNETDVDCGGSCPKCVQGNACSVVGDCALGFCVDGFCCDKACSGVCEACSLAKSGAANGTCGGLAAGSNPKAACPHATDVCGVGGKCRCSDGQKDGAESDTDCGGTVCGKCAQGKACNQPTDCGAPGVCADGFCCNAACGGCQACASALTGSSNGTCATVILYSDPHNTCTLGAGAEGCGVGGVKCQCNDGVENGSGGSTESDIDCGGNVCAGCAIGKNCTLNADCASGYCNATTLTCYAATCNNGSLDSPPETDVDCGGTCPKCANGATCAGPGDCLSGNCNAANKCTP